MIIQTLITSLLLSGALHSLEFSFIPPKNWHIVPPEKNPCIGFVGPLVKGFAPSINYRSVDLTLEENRYIDGVIKHYEALGHTCQNLGLFPLDNFKAHLLQIDQKKPFGTVRVWQLILIEEKRAHLLTCVSRLEEFTSYQSFFRKSFDSIHLVDDLLDLSDKKKLIEMALHLKKDKKMLKFLQKNHQHLGPFWQAQCLARLQKMGCIQ